MKVAGIDKSELRQLIHFDLKAPQLRGFFYFTLR